MLKKLEEMSLSEQVEVVKASLVGIELACEVKGEDGFKALRVIENILNHFINEISSIRRRIEKEYWQERMDKWIETEDGDVIEK